MNLKRLIFPCLLTTSLVALVACHGPANHATGSGPSVAVHAVMPHKQTFHHHMEVWGSVAADPRHARSLSLAYPVQITTLQATPGQSVRKGQALMTVAPAPAARKAYLQAQANLRLAQADLQHVQKLARGQLATTAQVNAARKALADAQATMQAQRATGAGNAHQIIRAPADGIVTAISASLGQRVAANAPLAGFMPAHARVAVLGISPVDGTKLHPGMPVQGRGAYGGTFAGKLATVGQQIDPQTHLLPARADIPASASSALLPGMAIKARIQTDRFTAWAIPRNALQSDTKGPFILQIERGKAHRVDVKVLSPDGSPVGVKGALDANAPVITLGSYELADGDAVHATTAGNHGAGTR